MNTYGPTPVLLVPWSSHPPRGGLTASSLHPGKAPECPRGWALRSKVLQFLVGCICLAHRDVLSPCANSCRCFRGCEILVFFRLEAMQTRATLCYIHKPTHPLHITSRDMSVGEQFQPFSSRLWFIASRRPPPSPELFRAPLQREKQLRLVRSENSRKTKSDWRHRKRTSWNKVCFRHSLICASCDMARTSCALSVILK